MEYENYNNLTGSLREKTEFLRLGLYVDDHYNEVDVVCYSSRVLTDKSKHQYYRIYTTLKCNAKCPYCYERGAEPISMSEKTADNICNFIVDNMVDNTRIILEWFGGEPLLNKKIINYICNKISPICEQRGIKYLSRMTTNGLLVDEEIINDALKTWNLTQVQITLDGLKQTYERIKGFDTKNAFDRVICNILLLLDNNFKVTVRLNYDIDNYKEILELIDFFGERFSKYDNLKISYKKIMNKNDDNSLKASEDLDLGILMKCLNNGLIKNTIDTIQHRDNTCVAHMLHSFMILPDGKIGKCSQAISDNDIIGDVVNGIDENKIVRWCSPRLNQECLDCNLLPLCNGGCLYEKFLNKNFCFASEKILNYTLKHYLMNYYDSSLK
jgi:uncharacterized protein